jgi:hypothetical protein
MTMRLRREQMARHERAPSPWVGYLDMEIVSDLRLLNIMMAPGDSTYNPFISDPSAVCVAARREEDSRQTIPAERQGRRTEGGGRCGWQAR